MERRYSQIRDVEGGRKEVIGFYDFAADYFSKEFKIDRSKFPKLRITRDEKAVYNIAENQITIGDNEFISDIGDTVGEELGHYVRAEIKGVVGGKESTFGEEYVDEFFGFLGSRALYQVCNGKQKQDFFSDGERTFENNYEGKNYLELRKEMLRKAKEKKFPKLKRDYKVAEENGDVDKMQRIGQEARSAGYGEHLKNLAHVRPYHFASEMSWSRIGNLRQLYSLSDESVKKRFFREDKFYGPKDGLARSGLERRVAVVLAISLIMFLIDYRSINGNVIGFSIFNFSIISIFSLILALSCFSFLIYRLFSRSGTLRIISSWILTSHKFCLQFRYREHTFE